MPANGTTTLDTINWGTSVAESTSTLGVDRLDVRDPPDQYHVWGAQISALKNLLLTMSAYFKGGARLQVIKQASNPFGAGETGFYIATDGTPYKVVDGTPTAIAGGATLPYVIANTYPGDDIGAQINAANADLGGSPGTIAILPGAYVMTTQVVLSTDRVLRLPLGSIKWAGPDDSFYGMFVFNDRNSIIGEGFNSILIESDRDSIYSKVMFMPFGSHGGGTFAPDADGPTDVYLADFQIQQGGVSTLFTGNTSTVFMGNSHRATVTRVCLNGTTALGIVIGGGSGDDFHASDVSVSHCQLLGVATQSVSCVNGKNVNVSNNIFTRDGVIDGVSGGSTFIDFEANASDDILENFVISNNVMDGVGGTNCNGISVNAADATIIGPGIVANNTIRGGLIDGSSTNGMSNGILGNAIRDLLVIGNTVRRVGQDGISLGGCTRALVVGNNLSFIGTTDAIVVDSCSYCRFKSNTVSGSTGTDAGGWAIIIKEINSSDYNTFEENYIDDASPYHGHILLVGAHSKSYNNSYGTLPPCVERQFDSSYAASVLGGTLVKLDPSHAGKVKPFLVADAATRPLGVVAVTPGTGDYYAHVVEAMGVEVGALSDGTTSIAPGDSIQPSLSVAGRVMKGTANQIGWATNTVAATLDLVVQTVLVPAPASTTAGDMVLASTQTVTGAKTFNDGKLKQNNSANTFATTLATLASAARTWTLPDATDTAVGLATAQTFATGVKTFLDGKLALQNAANTFAATFANAVTAARTITIPDATDTLAVLATAQSFITGVKTFKDGILGLRNVADSFTSFFTNTNTASRTYTLPDATGTVPLLETRNAWTLNQRINEHDYGSISGAAVAIDSQYGQGKTSLTGACTLSAPIGSPAAGDTMTLAVTNATGSATLDVSASAFKFPGGTEPVLTATSGARDIMSFRYNGSTWDCVSVQAMS